MEIRNPDRTHGRAVFELLDRCFGGAWNENEVSDRIFYDAAYDPNLVWMAREGGRVLGVLVSTLEAGEGRVKLIAVDETARRRGLGGDRGGAPGALPAHAHLA